MALKQLHQILSYTVEASIPGIGQIPEMPECGVGQTPCGLPSKANSFLRCRSDVKEFQKLDGKIFQNYKL